MPSAGFEPAIPASERPQTVALDWAAIGIGRERSLHCQIAGGTVLTYIYIFLIKVHIDSETDDLDCTTF